MSEYTVSLKFESGFWAENIAVSAPDDAMAIREAIDGIGATNQGDGFAIVRHQYLPGAIKYSILT